jgi:tight adherence protein B
MRALDLAMVFVGVFAALLRLPDPAVRRHLFRAVRRRRRLLDDEPGNRPRRLLRLPDLGRRFHDSRLEARLKARLDAAGLDLYPAEAVVVALAVAALLALVLLLLLGPVGLLLGPALAVVAGEWGLGFLAGRRQRTLSRQLPDTLQLLAQALRSGHSLAQALDVAARETPAPLGQELARTVQEMRLSVAVEDALGSLAARVGTREMEILVTAVLIQRQVGGNLADILDRIQGTLRDRIRIAGEVSALTAQGRLSGLIVGLLPIAIALIANTLNPGFLAPLFHTAVGRGILLLSGVLELLGLYAIRRIVQVEY